MTAPELGYLTGPDDLFDGLKRAARVLKGERSPLEDPGVCWGGAWASA